MPSIALILLSYNNTAYDIRDDVLMRIADFANSFKKMPKFELKVPRERKIITLQSKLLIY